MVTEALIAPLPEDWELTTLGEACRRGGGDIQTGPFGSQLHASDYVPVGVPSIMPQNIGDNRVVEEGIARISPSDAARLDRYLVRVGDIIYSRRGDVERRALIRPEQDGWLCGTGCLRIRFGEDNVDPVYATYYLGHPNVREWIVRHAHGATMPNLNTSILSALPFVVPPKKYQSSIAHMLSTLDDKIELNCKMSDTLEAIARAIFKAWFVDFEPVHGKGHGRWQEGQSLPGLPPSLYKLFPHKLTQSRTVEYPEGWTLVPLPECFDFLEGPGIRNWQYTNTEEGTKFINIRCIKGGDITLGSANRVKDEEAYGKYKHFLLQPDDLVVSTSGTLGKSAIIRPSHLPLMLNTSVIRFRPIENVSTKPFLYGYATSPEFQSELEMRASGSVQKNFGPMHLKQMQILMPPYDLLHQHERLVQPLYSKIISNRNANDALVAVRDAVLPMLLSGQVKMREIENLVGSAIQ